MQEVHQARTAPPPHNQHHTQQEKAGCHGERDWEPISEPSVLVTQQVAVISVEALGPFFFLFLFSFLLGGIDEILRSRKAL